MSSAVGRFRGRALPPYGTGTAYNLAQSALGWHSRPIARSFNHIRNSAALHSDAGSLKEVGSPHNIRRIYMDDVYNSNDAFASLRKANHSRNDKDRLRLLDGRVLATITRPCEEVQRYLTTQNLADL